MSQFVNTPQPSPYPSRLRPWSTTARLGLFALAYWLVVRLGLLLVAQPEGVASIWPVSGLVLAVLLLRPKHEWTQLLGVIFITNTIGNWTSGNSLSVSLSFALANTLEPLVCAWVMIYLCKTQIRFDRIREVLALLVVAVFANGLTALLGAAVPWLAFGAPYWHTWEVWWVADGLGMVLVTPLIVTWVRGSELGRFQSWRQSLEAILLILTLAIFSWLVFGPYTVAEKPLLRAYMFFPFLIWLAFRFSPRGMTSALLMVAIIAVWGTLQATGLLAYASLPRTDNLISVQMLLWVLVSSGLLISAIVIERQRGTEKVVVAEANYRNIFENAPVGFFQSSPSGHFITVNPMMAQIFGFETPADMLDEITDISSQIYLDPTLQQEVAHPLSENRLTFEFTSQNRRRDGSLIWTNTNARVVKDLDGNILYYEGFLKDITALQEAGEALQQSEAKYRLLYESMSQGVFYQQADGKLVDANKAALEMLGLTREQFLGKTSIDLDLKVIHPDGSLISPEEYPSMRALRTGQIVENIELGVYRPNQQDYTWLVVNAIPQLKPGENHPDQVFVTLHNITKRKQTEVELLRRTREAETLRKASAALTSSLDLEQVLDNLLNQLGQVVPYDSATVFLLNNGQLQVVAGRGLPHLEEILGQTFPDDNQLFLDTKRTGHPLIIADAQRDPQFRNWGGADYIHGWMGIPLIVGGELIGHLTIDSRVVGAYNKSQSELALAFANQSAIALHNARLYKQAQHELYERQRAEAAFRNYFNISTVGMCVTSPEKGWIEVNDHLCQMLGYTRAELTQGSWAEVTHPEDLQADLELFNQVLAGTRDSYELDKRFIRKDGEVIYTTLSVTCQRQPDGTVHHFLASIMDITTRKNAEAALRTSEEKYRTVADFTYDWETWRGPNGNYLYVSPSCERISGRKAEEFLADPQLLVKIAHPDDRAAVIEHLELSDQEDIAQSLAFEFRILTPDGSIRWISHFCVPVHDEDGQWLGRRQSNREITERKLSELSLRESEEKYRNLYNEAALGIFHSSFDGKFLDVNPTLAQMLGYASPEEVLASIDNIGTQIYVEPPKRDIVIQKALQAGETIHVENLYKRKDGSTWQGLLHLRQVKDSQGQPIHLEGFVEDITERKRAEMALRESEERFHSMFENHDAAMLLIEPASGQILDANLAAQQFYGYSGTELQAMSIDQINALSPAEVAERRTLALKKHINYFVFPHRLATGEIRTVEVHSTPIVIDGKQTLFSIIHDITDQQIARDALSASEERYRRLTEAITDYIYTVQIKDRKVVETRHGPGCVGVTGYTPEEFAADPYLWHRMIWPADRDLLQDEIGELLAGHDVFREHRIIHKDGRVRWIRDTLSPHFDEHHELVSYDGLVQDITERKRAELAQLASERRYREMLENVNLIGVMIDLEGRVTFCNDYLLQLTGWERKDVLNQDWFARFVPSDQGVKELFLESIQNEAFPPHFENQILTRNGELRQVAWNNSMLWDVEGRLVGIASLGEDITERKRAEEALRESEEHYRRIVDTAYEGIWVVDEAYKTTFINGRMEEMLGYPIKEVLGQRVDAFLYEEDLPELQKFNPHLHHLDGQQERRFRRKDGSELWVLVSAKPMLNEQGIFRGSFAMFSDITERKKVEADLQKFAFIVNTAPEYMSLVNRQYTYEAVNDAYCRARGKTRIELIGHTLAEVWSEALFEEVLRPRFERCFSGEVVRYEETFSFTGEDLRTFQVGMYPYHDGPEKQVTHVVVVTSDITEFIQKEEALRLSELNLKKAQQFARLGSWTWDIRTNNLEWSDEMYNIFDVDQATFTGSLAEVIARSIHPEDRAKVEASNLSVIQAGQPIPVDYRIIRQDGSMRVIWAEAGELVRDETGQPILLRGTVQDITERKKMEDDLRNSLAEKEALLREVHHRVKNNLQIVSSLLSMQASASGNSQVIYALEESRNRVRSMALIHEKLYRSKNLEYIQTEEYVSELLDHLTSSFSGQIKNISFDFQIASLTFSIDKAIPCGMIITELVSNALKYAFPADQAGGFIKVYLSKEAEKVRLEISDTGVGLPDEIDLRHPETLGLELVSILTRQLKGDMEVKRQPGTTFVITFEA